MMDLGIDLGTGSVKVALWHEGTLVREASVTYRVDAPRAGWAESNPNEWWAATVQATREVLRLEGPGIRSIGLSGQMHGVVLCDARGRPIRAALLWADTRAARQLHEYRALSPAHLASLRNPVTTGMAGPSLLWLRDHEPDAYRSARWALQPKDWLRQRLTGEVHAEPSDASGTLLYDLEDDTWNWPLMEGLDLRGELLAPLVASRHAVGSLRASAARELGLPGGVVVAAGGADTAAALLGTGVPPGQVQLTIGSGAQVVARSELLPSARRGLHVFREARDEGWYTLAAVQNAGVALEWARRVLRCSWVEFYHLAHRAPPGAGGLLFLPYLTGDRTPHLDPSARGGWIGAGLEHDTEHLARAAFEGVAFSIAQAALLLPEANRSPWRLAGGGSLDPWWRQLLADVLRTPLELVEVPSASAVGAALLGGAAASGLSPASLAWKPSQRIEPVVDVRYLEAQEKFAAAYRSLRPWFGQDGRTSASDPS